MAEMRHVAEIDLSRGGDDIPLRAVNERSKPKPKAHGEKQSSRAVILAVVLALIALVSIMFFAVDATRPVGGGAGRTAAWTQHYDALPANHFIKKAINDPAAAMAAAKVVGPEDLPVDKWAIADAALFRPLANTTLASLNGPPAREGPYPFEAVTEIDTLLQAKDHHTGMCQLAMLSFGYCEPHETVIACVVRAGPRRLHRALPTNCTSGRAWQLLVKAALAAQPSSPRKEGNKTTADSSEAQEPLPLKIRDDFFYDPTETVQGPLPEEQWPKAAYAPAINCGKGRCVWYPIAYALPAVNAAPAVDHRKLFSFMPLLPNRLGIWWRKNYHNFRSGDEWMIHALNQASFFSLTHRRGGWDALRHVEILFAGTVPYFVDMMDMPPAVMSTFPRELVRKAMSLPGPDIAGVFSYIRSWNKGAVHPYWSHTKQAQWLHWNKVPKFDMVKFNKLYGVEYFDIANRILNHTKEHMTTAGLAARILRALNVTKPRRVLVLSGCGGYMPPMVMSGLSDLRVPTDTLCPRGAFIYKRPRPTRSFSSFAEYQAWHRLAIPGKAIHWHFQMRVDPRIVIPLEGQESLIEERLANKEYDAVIYARYSAEVKDVTTLDWYPRVRDSVGPKRIAFLEFTDWLTIHNRPNCSAGVFFKREMICDTPHFLKFRPVIKG